MTPLGSVLISGAATVVVAFLVWLVTTRKVVFPLLFDVGLSVITFGVIVLADGALHDKLSVGGSIMCGAGLLILLLSYMRQTRKYERQHPRNPLRKLNKHEMRHTPGGKQ